MGISGAAPVLFYLQCEALVIPFDDEGVWSDQEKSQRGQGPPPVATLLYMFYYTEEEKQSVNHFH